MVMVCEEFDYEVLLWIVIVELQKVCDVGNYFFVFIFVGLDGKVFMIQYNVYMFDYDMIGYVECVLMICVFIMLLYEFLKECMIYILVEFCVMCVGVIYWIGFKCCVYGMMEKQLKEIIGNYLENLMFDLFCEVVFVVGQCKVEVIGLILVEELVKVYEGFWG